MAYDPWWILKQDNQTLMMKATLPLIFRRFVEELFRFFKINGRFYLFSLNQGIPLPFIQEFDIVWMFSRRI